MNPDICEVDKIADEIIRSRFSSLNFVTEEYGFQDNRAEETLYADPLDGTSFYLMGKKYSCVSLGLKRNNELVIGVIYNGLTDQLYTAEKGSGAYLTENGIKRRLKTKDTRQVKDAALAVPSLKVLLSDKKNAETFKKLIQATWRFDCEGCIGLNLCEIADGIFDAMILPKIGGPWDYAAGIVIVKEAGGYLGDWKGEDFDIDNQEPIIAASNKELYDHFQTKFFGGR